MASKQYRIPKKPEHQAKFTQASKEEAEAELFPEEENDEEYVPDTASVHCLLFSLVI